jgi:hypothetical protein
VRSSTRGPLATSAVSHRSGSGGPIKAQGSGSRDLYAPWRSLTPWMQQDRARRAGAVMGCARCWGSGQTPGPSRRLGAGRRSSRASRSRCASVPQDGRSKGRSPRARGRLVRHGPRRSSWTGTPTTAGHRFDHMPAWGKAVASLLWTPRRGRSPLRRAPTRGVAWCKTTLGAAHAGISWRPGAPCRTRRG